MNGESEGEMTRNSDSIRGSRPTWDLSARLNSTNKSRQKEDRMLKWMENRGWDTLSQHMTTHYEKLSVNTNHLNL